MLSSEFEKALLWAEIFIKLEHQAQLRKDASGLFFGTRKFSPLQREMRGLIFAAGSTPYFHASPGTGFKSPLKSKRLALKAALLDLTSGKARTPAGDLCDKEGPASGLSWKAATQTRIGEKAMYTRPKTMNEAFL